MKNTFKKFAIIALSCMMVFALAACGGGGGSSESSGAGELHIGGIGPLTGPAALYGQAVKNGAEIAVKEINEANPDGVQIVFDMQDDEHDPEKSVNAYNTLVDDGMQVLVGTVTSAPCTAVSAEAYANRTFALTPSASATSVVEGNDNVFQLCFQDPQQGQIAAEYIAKNFPDAVVGAIYNNSDNYSSGIFDAFKKALGEKGMSVAAEEAFASDDNADFSAQLNKMKNANVDLLFLPIYYTPASNIMKQAHDMGYAPKYFGCDGLDGILALEGFDTALAEGALLLTPFSADAEDEATQAFVSAYQEAYGEKPIQFAADAYDCIYTVYNCFNETGLGTDASMEEICEAMIEKFNGGFTATGLTASGDMKWAPTGEVEKAPKIYLIQDGKYVEQ